MYLINHLDFITWLFCLFLEMCIKDLNKLENSGLIKLEEGFLVKPKGWYSHI